VELYYDAGTYEHKKKFILFFGLRNVFVLECELRPVGGILVNTFLHTWCIQKFVNHIGRVEIWPESTTYLGRRDERNLFFEYKSTKIETLLTKIWTIMFPEQADV